MEVIVQAESQGAGADLQRAIDLLHEVRDGSRGSTLRLYSPVPTMAFGQRDTHLPGFDAATAAARNHGFEPLVRKAGGRAMPYHQGCLVVDSLEPEDNAMLGARKRFGQFGEYFAHVLRSLGVDAAVGEIPGEYCPGEFSVHGTFPTQAADAVVPGELGTPPSAELQKVKLVGTAQRVISGAWLFSSAILVQDSAPLREALVDTYAALDLPLDAQTVGSMADLRPGLTVETVQQAVLNSYSDFFAA